MQYYVIGVGPSDSREPIGPGVQLNIDGSAVHATSESKTHKAYVPAQAAVDTKKKHLSCGTTSKPSAPPLQHRGIKVMHGISPFNQLMCLDKCPAWSVLTEAEQLEFARRMPRLAQLAAEKGYAEDGEIQEIMGDIIGTPFRGADPSLTTQYRKQHYEQTGELQYIMTINVPIETIHSNSSTYNTTSSTSSCRNTSVAPTNTSNAGASSFLDSTSKIAKSPLQDMAFNRYRACCFTPEQLRTATNNRVKREHDKMLDKALTRKKELKDARGLLGIAKPLTLSNAPVHRCANSVCMSTAAETTCLSCALKFCSATSCIDILRTHMLRCVEQNQQINAARKADLIHRQDILLQQAAQLHLHSSSVASIQLSPSPTSCVVPLTSSAPLRTPHRNRGPVNRLDL